MPEANHEDDPIEYNDDVRSRMSLAFCRNYYKIIGYLAKFPRYTGKYYLKNIASLPDSEQMRVEKQIWLQWTPFNRFGDTSLILVVYFFFLSLKYFMFVYYTMMNVDFKHPDWNLIKVEGKQNERQFVCLRTNCSKLSQDNELAQDLIQLPVFSICQPWISWSYNPMISSHQIGLLLTGIFMYFVFVATFVEPVIARTSSVHFRLATFVTCPNIARRLQLERTRRFCSELAESYSNYQVSRSMLLLSQPGRRLSSLLDPTRRRSQTISIDHSDCSPINSTRWWHQQLVSTFPMVWLFFSSSIFVLTIFFNVWAHLIISQDHRGRYSRYCESIEEQDNNPDQATCSIWTTSGANIYSKSNPGKLNENSSTYNTYTACEYSFSMLIINILLTMAVNDFYETTNDIQININELKFQLEIAIQLAELRMTSILVQPSSPTDVRPPASSLFAEIRRRVIENSSYSSGIIITKPLRRSQGNKTTTHLEHRLACEEFAFHLLDQFGSSVEVFAEFLEKIQINYWNFAHLIGEHDRPLSGLLFLCYIINFGFSLISVYLSRKFIAHHLFSLLVNMVAVMVLNVYIASASIVHSQARRLESKLWSLVASNSRETNERVRHSNHLAIKQLRSMDANGGLAVRAFGINVTYVRIIEVSFWTTSIILLAYTRH